MNPYRTLVFAHLVQESPLNVGGNAPHGLVDIPLARDGKGRPVIRGTTLAGCFINTARALAGHLPPALTFKSTEQRNPGEQTAPVPSAWRFSHAHPIGTAHTAFFQHVSIDIRTQAAKDDHLFSIEALPPGVCWNFEMEIVPTAEADFAELEALAAATLNRWQQPGGARLGRGSRHGYGWCHLEEIAIVRLDTRHIHLWPDAFAPARNSSEWVAYFRGQGVEVLDLPAFLALHADRLPQSRRYIAELTGTVQIGERQDPFGKGYGLDTLSIGGHARLYAQAQEFFDHIIAPPDIAFQVQTFEPDFVITALPEPDGKLIPYVPGSSIRGVWRAQLTRHVRAQGGDTTLIETLFGSTERAGRLSIADATLANDDWKLLWHQHVAIDELTGGAYGSAKFDRLSIARARFHWRATIEAESEQEARKLAEPLCQMLQTLGDGHLPLGGGIWRGHGHVTWNLDACTIRPMSTPT
ncbi:MAG TPA: RAMP superfamily CRISPR-associated protein [Hydrogenophilus thermoluteolus]|nr:RAMP superfamily CRISPR-associated protein [Hydrogenophilus thermoluteolus]